MSPLLATPLAVALFVLLAGCQSTPRAVPFDEAALAPFAAPGNNELTGQIQLTRNGEPQPLGAASTVYLTPVTPYTTEWYEQAVVKRAPLAANDPRLRKY